MALTVAELAQRPEQRVAYLFVVDGLRYMWSDVLDLCGSGAGSWLGEDYGDRVVLLGHGGGDASMIPDSIETGTDLESGMLRGSSIDINITDRDGVLIELMKEPDEVDYFAERLSPTMDPAPATVVGWGGATVDVHGRCVGAETIGPAGERHLYNCFPGSSLPGMDHAAVDSTDNLTIARSAISDAPEWLQGRRCALYVIRADPTTGLTGAAAYPDWQTQFDSGYSLLWWGTVQTVDNEGHVWKIACDGPDSLLRKSLNTTSPSEWRPLSGNLSLRTDPGEREDLMGIAFNYLSPDVTINNRRCGYSLFDETDDVIPSGLGVSALADTIRARLTTLSAATGPDGEEWTNYRNSALKFDLGVIAVRTDDDSPALNAIIHLCLHEKVWRYLGWDPITQARTVAEIESQYDAPFKPLVDFFTPMTGITSPVPGPGYYYGTFGTIPVGMTAGENGPSVDSDGVWRSYFPLVEAGVTMLQPQGGQEVTLAFGSSPYWTGQLARPVADHVMTNGLPCDRTGFLVFKGSYRESIEEDAIDRYAVAKVSWASQNETISEDGEGACTVFVERYLDPRLFGFKDPPFKTVWSALNLEWSTLAVIGYNTNSLDYAHLVALRLLLSTGTKAFDAGSYEGVPGATYELGDNAHPDAVAPHLEGSDQDIADLGLAVPHELIDWQSFINTADALPVGGFKSNLNRVKIAYQGPFDSQQLLEDLLKPRAWAMGLAGYRYSLHSMPAVLDADDATVTITEADLDSQVFPYVPKVGMTPFTGVDTGEIEYHFSATSEGGETSSEPIKPLSARAKNRHGNSSISLTGRGLVDRRHWIDDKDNAKPEDWLSAWRQLWNSTMSEYLLAPHQMLEALPVRSPKANSLNPGTVVLLTNAWAATRTGAYGMIGRVGRVMSVRRDTQSLTATCDILVQAGDANTRRRFSPIAAVLDDVETLEKRHDAASRTIFCYGDRFGASGGSDVKYFAEPSWSAIGGDALVHGYSYDGSAWSKKFQFEVESVDTTAHTITYKAGTFSGTFREREYHVLVLAGYDDQTAAWPKALFLVHTLSTGKFGAGTKGFPLMT
jgi:hypothetical protein